MASSVVDAEVKSDLVSRAVEYSVILPPGSEEAKDLPLILSLHGGTGSRENLKNQKAFWDRLFESKEIPPLVVATPSVRANCFYFDFKDGSEKWESFVVGPFLDHLRREYPVSREPKRTFLMGFSMGGQGSLLMAFRHPERFGAVAALESAIEPVLSWEDMRPKHRFFRDLSLFERACGKPVDPEYWAASNPATMVTRDADRIRASGLQIYIEVGDEDQTWLYEGTEFLHQVLWNYKIRHEYHLVRGADHVGPSVGERQSEAVRFLVRSFNPWGPPPALFDPLLKEWDRLKAALGEKDHFGEP